MRRFSWFVFNFILLLALVWGGTRPWSLSPNPAAAQEADPTPTTPIPQIHIVQEGETLVYIATLYGTTVEALQIINGIDDPSYLFLGQELRIPGAEGEAVPLVVTLQMGETVADIALRYNTTITAVAGTNQLVQTTGLAAGDRLTVISQTGSETAQPITGRPHLVTAEDTLLTLAAQYDLVPQRLAEANGLSYPTRLFPGQRLRIPLAEAEPYRFLPGGWVAVEMGPFPAVPGDSFAVYVNYLEDGEPLGELLTPDNTAVSLHFSPAPDGMGHVAIVGLDAFADPGRYTLSLGGEGSSRPWFPFSQDFYLRPADYTVQNIPLDDQPDIRADEDAFLSQIFTQINPDKLWEGTFQMPVSPTIVTARYGDARSYNGAPITIFHTGIDFAGQNGTPIAAPANGQVAFVGTLNLRGETIILDHGWGVYTAYYHLSQINVAVNDAVRAGQVIGLGGSTGLSTGPHLHWDVRVHDTAVNPVRWTEVAFP